MNLGLSMHSKDPGGYGEFAREFEHTFEGTAYFSRTVANFSLSSRDFLVVCCGE